MNNFGLGNRKITDNFEVTLPSGRKTEFTRAKTQYIRYSLSLQRSDFANAPVALAQELELLMKVRTLAEKEGFKDSSPYIKEIQTGTACISIFAIILMESGIWKAISFALIVIAAISVGYRNFEKINHEEE